MLYQAIKVVATPVLGVSFRPWAEGLGYVPLEGPVIIASNHNSFSDSIFLPLMVPRTMHFLAKSDYFTGTGIKGRLTAAFFRGVGQLPVDRSGGRASEGALRAGLKVLDRGDVLGIYPEGTRSPDGRLYRGHTGVARMAVSHGVSVVPAAIFGTREVQPPGQLRPHLTRVGVRFGKPLDFSRYEGMGNDRYVLRAMTDQLMYEIMKLSGQEYVDTYASAVKKALEAAQKAEKKELKELKAVQKDKSGAPILDADAEERHPRAS